MDEGTLHWYAARVFYNRYQLLVGELNEEEIEYFIPSKVVPSLLFVRCTSKRIAEWSHAHYEQMHVYSLPGQKQATAIPDEEMEVFRFVVTAGEQGLTYLGDDKPEYHQGDRVVVTDGPFKGAEGHIKRIKRDRRLVVSIRGVVAVATTYIHPKFLKKIDDNSPSHFRLR